MADAALATLNQELRQLAESRVGEVMVNDLAMTVGEWLARHLAQQVSRGQRRLWRADIHTPDISEAS